jgi:3-oxoadipate enol-lactonase
VEHEGATLFCTVEGREEGPWLLLSHGLATDLGMWDELADALRSDYRVVRYDARGHGRSSGTPGDYPLELLVADALAVLDGLDIAKAHFVGLSMGGMVGLGLALVHPQRVESATIANARGIGSPEYRKSWSERSRAVRERGVDDLVEPTVTRWFTPEFRSRASARVDRFRAMIRSTSTDGYCGCAAALQQVDFADRLHAMSVPTLFIAGSDDQGVPPAVVQDLHARTPGSRYVEITGAAHITSVEQPTAFADAVTHFLAGIARPDGHHRQEP